MFGVSGRKTRLILWVKVAKAVCESCHGFKVLRVWQCRKSWRIFYYQGRVIVKLRTQSFDSTVKNSRGQAPPPNPPMRIL